MKTFIKILQKYVIISLFESYPLFTLCMDLPLYDNSIYSLIYILFRHSMTPAYLTIGGCWVSSLAIGLPIMFGLNHRPEPESFFLNNFTNIREESFNLYSMEELFCEFEKVLMSLKFFWYLQVDFLNHMEFSIPLPC